MDLLRLGSWFREFILELAQRVVTDDAPGFISLGILAFAGLIGFRLWWTTRSRTMALARACNVVRQATPASGRSIDLARIEVGLSNWRDVDSKSVTNAFREFRETLLIGRGDEMAVRNSIRPAAFLNIDDMGFSLKAWRILPGLLVSVGLFFTFMGLVAVLTVAAEKLVGADGSGTASQMVVLRDLLDKASAKFIISLTGLFCSILMNIWITLLSGRVERRTEELCQALETSMTFVSLEGLAEDQLRAVRDQSESLRTVVTELVAELGKSIEQAAVRSEKSIEKMVQGVGANISSGIGESLERAAERVEEASKSLDGLGESLGRAAETFDGALNRSVETLNGVLRGIEAASRQLVAAADSLTEASPKVIETLREGHAHSLRVAEGATEMVNAAKLAIHEEKTVVLDAADTIKTLLRAFESRAAAYDGQLEKAFAVYQTQVAETLGRLQSHGADVQNRFGEALATLSAVIQNAKAFEPESNSESSEPLLDPQSPHSETVK
ncbi:MAG: hypothetical protein KDK24_05730 [Pseudooceanicola sp.]|nr:hypothetical protein [Pseudooceanicola sp.]